MEAMLDLVDQKYKNENRLSEPCPSKSAIFVHEHCAAVELTLGPAPEEACGDSSFAGVRSKGNYAFGHADAGNDVDQQSSLARSACKVAL